MEHRLAEIPAKLRVEPRSTNDDMLATRPQDSLLSMKFRQAIDTRWSSLLVFPAWRVGNITSKDIIRRDMDEQSIDFLHDLGKIRGGNGIQSLHDFTCRLSSIHIGPGRAVDDDVHSILSHHRADSFQIGNVEIRGFLVFLLVHIREDVMVRTLSRHDTNLVAKLPICASYKYIHAENLIVFPISRKVSQSPSKERASYPFRSKWLCP